MNAPPTRAEVSRKRNRPSAALRMNSVWVTPRTMPNVVRTSRLMRLEGGPRRVVLRHRRRREDAAAVRHLERRLAVLVHRLEHDRLVPDDRVDVEDVAGDEALEHVERAPVAERVEGRPEVLGPLDLLHADGRGLRARLEDPGQRRRVGEAPRSARRSRRGRSRARGCRSCAPSSARRACRGSSGPSSRPCPARAGARAGAPRSRRRSRRGRRCGRCGASARRG